MGKKEELGYFWVATFNDKNVISQFDGEDEIPFIVIDGMLDELKEFKITDATETESFVADFVNQKLYSKNTEYVLSGENPQLIYKRRNRVRMEVGGSGKILDSNVTHIIGMKTTTDEQQFEVFAGQEVRPKKINYVNNLSKEKFDITVSY